MTTIDIMIGRLAITATVNRHAPLGWRFWMLAGFPGDPIDPRPYGGSRCVPITLVAVEGHPRWLCAMELDRSFQLFCSHDLFPCDRQSGAEAFAHTILERHSRQPHLL